MSTYPRQLGCQDLLMVFNPNQVREWFAAVELPVRRRTRRLSPEVVFHGILMYAMGGLRNLAHAMDDVVAEMAPDQPPVGVSKGSVTPARRRLPVEVLQAARAHLGVLLDAARATREGVAGLQVRCIDGTSFAVADTLANEAAYGRPGSARGETAFPRLRSVLAMDAATHAFVGEAHGGFATHSESQLTDELLGQVVTIGILLEADRGFYSFARVTRALRLGGELLIRVKANMKLPVLAELADGSYLSWIRSPKLARSRVRSRKIEQELSRLGDHQLLELAEAERLELLAAADDAGPEYLLVRIVEYDVLEAGGRRTHVRLLTSILDPQLLEAKSAADGYHLRWGEELGIRELKWLADTFRIPHLPGQSPASIEQEYLAMLLVHDTLRYLMMLAARQHDADPTRLSFSDTRAVLTRYLVRVPRLTPDSLDSWASELLREVARHRLPPPADRVCPRAVKVKMSTFPTKSRCKSPPSAPAHRRFEFRPALVPVP